MARVKGLDHEIRRLRQPLENLLPLTGLNIQRDASFVRIVGEEKKALLLVSLTVVKGADIPPRISFGRLNFDHVGTQVPQNFPTKIALLIGQIQYAIRA